ncbi:TPA: hypothetical protein HA251_02880 [Candidatus Woesearchaeota archaeon]|nr:hypothetical protein [Candidatus Woesearchaeota archaeon]
MRRYEFDLTELTHEHGKSLVPHLKGQLADLELNFFVDDKLLFDHQHFDPNIKDGAGFATYKNGHKKGGALRFMQWHIRMPAYDTLPVYETKEYSPSASPRAIVTIPSFVVCPARHLTQDELDMDGFRDHDEMIREMQRYYKTITRGSIVSFYRFGDAILRPTPQELKSYLHTHQTKK